MKKILLFLSLSLISAYAVSFGKIDISGNVNYEIEDKLAYGVNNSDREAEHDIDLDLKLQYPVSNETIFTLKIDDDNTNDEKGSALDLKVDQIYISYQKNNQNFQLGLQEIAGPFFYEKNGDGLLFLRSSDTNILALSYYVNNTYSGADEVLQAAMIGEMGNINYSAWYSQIQDSEYSATGNNGTASNYDSKVMQFSIFKQEKTIKFGVTHTKLDSDNDSTGTVLGEQSQTVLFIDNEDSSLAYSFAYIQTGQNGGNVALDQETDSEANYSLDEIGANDITDGKAYYASLTKFFEKTDSIKIEYFKGDGTISAEETKLTYSSFLGKDLFFYASADQWSKSTINDNQKIEIGFNISF